MEGAIELPVLRLVPWRLYSRDQGINGVYDDVHGHGCRGRSLYSSLASTYPASIVTHSLTAQTSPVTKVITSTERVDKKKVNN